MPAFMPFHALRYASGTDLDAVIAPPYDVLSAADVHDLADRDAHNIVHIDVPGGSPDPYQAAAAQMTRWLTDGVLVRDPEESFTIYRMSFTDAAGHARIINGVLGGLEVVDEGAGGVLPHENTTPKAKTDRLDLTRATAANLSPVWGLSLASGLTEALAEPGELVGRIEADGAVHQVERVTDPQRIAQISGLIATDDVLIADGHHRYAVSRTYRDEVRAASGSSDTEAEFTLTFINELVADQLSVEAIHRVYTNTTIEDLRALLAASFQLAPAPAPSTALLDQMVDTGRLVLIAPDGTCEWLIPLPNRFDDVRALDGAWLEEALAGSTVEVGYQHGVPEVLTTVTSGQADAAVLIRPTSVAEIQRTAREGLLMPPKSTFFTPKLRTGFVIRPTASLS
ncbi:MAG: DUF1015 family protein [Propioniciclava sp.]